MRIEQRRITRTCVGCRRRADKSDLLRVVAVVDAGWVPEIVPDVRARRPGRGAYLHRDWGCFELAERRRAFARALQLGAPPDLTAVRRWYDEEGLCGRPAAE